MATEVVMPQAGYPNMRRWPRYRLSVPVRVVVHKPDKTVIVTGRGNELSEGGMAVFAGAELKVGDRVEIEFTPPYGQPLRARSEVRNRSGYVYGMEFLTETASDRRQVKQIRQVLQAMASPES